MFKQVLGGFSNAANQLLSQVTDELPRTSSDATRRHWQPASPMDPFQGLSKEERDHILEVQRRANQEVESRKRTDDDIAPSSGQESVQEVLSPSLEVDSNEEENDVSSNVSTVKEIIKHDKVEGISQDGTFSSSSSETEGADELSDNSLDSTPTRNAQQLMDQEESIYDKEDAPTEHIYASGQSYQETSVRPTGGKLDRQPTIVVHSPSSSSYNTLEGSLTDSDERASLPDLETLQRSLPESSGEASGKVEYDQTTQEVHPTAFPIIHALTLSEEDINTRPTLYQHEANRRSSLPTWYSEVPEFVEEKEEEEEQVEKDSPEGRRKSSISLFDYDEASDPIPNYQEQLVRHSPESSLSTAEEVTHRGILKESRLCSESETLEEIDNPSKADICASNPLFDQTREETERIDSLSPDSYGIEVPSSTRSIEETNERETSTEEIHGTKADHTREELSIEHGWSRRPNALALIETVPEHVDGNYRLKKAEEAEYATSTLDHAREVSAVRNFERAAEYRPSVTNIQKNTISSFKASFGGLFNKTKTDLTSLASSVKTRTEAAIKRASDSVSSSLTTSPSTPQDMDMGRYKDLKPTITTDDNLKLIKSKSGNQIETEEDQGAGQILSQAQTSYTSDSTEDTGYTSRCSSADEFYRFASDGAQYVATYDGFHPVSVDQLKPAAIIKKVNPFLGKTKSETEESGPTKKLTSGHGELSKSAYVALDNSTAPGDHMYDSSEVSSEIVDEEEENRIREIESEFALEAGLEDEQQVGNWQMCPICQMNEIQTRLNGTHLTGQLCANCGFTVCSSCGGVQKANQKKLWLCTLCQTTMSREINSTTVYAKGQEPVDTQENSDKSDNSDEDEEDDDDSYPDVVIEVPNSPVKQCDVIKTSKDAEECFKVFRDIEKCFDKPYHDFESDHYGTQTEARSKEAMIQIEEQPGDEENEMKRQLSIGEEIFGQITEESSSETREDTADYAQARQYYTSQPLYVHRPGPVYTIVEENEEAAEADTQKARDSTKATNGSTQQEKVDKIPQEQQDERPLTVAFETPWAREEMKSERDIMDQSAEAASSKPIRVAPPPPLTFTQESDRRALESSENEAKEKKSSTPDQSGMEKLDKTSILEPPNKSSDTSTLLPSTGRKTEPLAMDNFASDFGGQKYFTTFGRLNAESQSVHSGEETVITSKEKLTRQEVDGTRQESETAQGMETSLKAAYEKQERDGTAFVSRLKRSPAMILSGIRESSEGAARATIAAPLKRTTPAESSMQSTFSDTNFRATATQGGENTKNYQNDQTLPYWSVDTGRRKLPTVPPTFGRYQTIPSERNVWTDQYIPKESSAQSAQGFSSTNWATLSRAQDTFAFGAKANAARRALPPTLARVLLKQELKEALQKRANRLEASEIEANHRHFVITRYLTTGVYPKSIGIDSAPKVVQSGLSPELTKGCVVKFNRLSSARPSKVVKTMDHRQMDILDRLSELERITKIGERKSVPTKTAYYQSQYDKSHAETQTVSPLKFKDADTQTRYNAEEALPLQDYKSKRKTIAIGTTDYKLYQTVSTDTEDLEDTVEDLPLENKYSGSRTFRDKHRRAFALFSNEDDSWSREQRRSKICREIDKRRQKFNSCEDLTTVDPSDIPFHDYRSSGRSFQPMGRLGYPQNPLRYSSLPRMDIQYENALRDAYHYPEWSYPSSYRNFDDVRNIPMDNRRMAYRDGMFRQSRLSRSQPDLLEIREPNYYDAYWRNRADERTKRASPSLLSEYANYLQNDFMRHPSVVNDYAYHSDFAPTTYASHMKADGNIRNHPLAMMQMPSRYGRYADTVEAMPASTFATVGELERKAQYSRGPTRLEDSNYIENSRQRIGTFEPLYSSTQTNETKPYYASRGQLNEPRKHGTRYCKNTLKSVMPSTGGEHYARRLEEDLHKQSTTPTSRRRRVETKKTDNTIRRILLVRDHKDKRGQGIGMRVIGGKILPRSDGELVAYVAAVYRGGLVDLMGQVKEGDQILEWNGIRLTGKTYEEVQEIIERTEGEVEIIIKSGANLNQVYRLDDEEGNVLDKGYESDTANSASKRLLQQRAAATENTMTIIANETERASPCFSTTPRARSPHAHCQNQRQQITTNGGSLKVRIYFESSTGTLFVNVIEAAMLLKQAQKKRMPNAFVKIYLLPARCVSNKRRTKYIRRNAYPRWNQTVVYKELTLNELVEKFVELTVWNYEWCKENTFMVLDALRMGSKAFWYPLSSNL